MDRLLEIEDLRIRFPARGGMVEAVRGLSFSLGRERLGLVGESGSGKSLTGRAILRLVRPPAQLSARHIRFRGDNLLAMSERRMRSIRGHRISMVMQDPKFSLNPVMRVGDQIAEAYRLHRRTTNAQAYDKTLEMLEAVQIRDPERVYRMYPHEVSGGMGQRIMIAMMLIPGPDILIADEPTSALDVLVQTQVLKIMDSLVRERGMGLLFISHDLPLLSAFCDRILVLYSGRIVEVCDASRLHQATHPYTQGLLRSIPRLDRPTAELPTLARSADWVHQESVSGVL